ncbi:DsrE family protein [Noviherbaspirillum autotrophicum]|uniref:Intracellular sulfur oxidation protein, DsrE/DsrF family n=1 Tax=Noviherbaspirillum autotrophicum TaxID=709839 RepID=A0A0C2BFG2_9BURK|nr:hypothetical protein [Noviherbaspirillum autotrophicum]KIF79965.1 hypothetical protein TSA66_02605 [Noviherbaspirillum autotrophicum]
MEHRPMILRVLIHAPTAASLVRARNNAANLLREAPDAQVRIIVNAEAVSAALDSPRSDTDSMTLVCANTLSKLGRMAPPPLQTVTAAILTIAEMQRDGWSYIRA